MLHGEGLEEIWEEFKQEMGLVMDFLELVGLKELREEIRLFRPLAMIRDEVGPVRRAVKEFTDKLYNVSLPLLLVFSVSCLEKFLRRLWLLKFGSIDKKMWRIFNELKDFAKEVRRRYGVEVGESTFKARAVVAKRNIILHNNGIVDQKALEAFIEAGKQDSQLGQRLKLSVEEVRRDINTILEFAERVKEIFDSSLSH